MEKLMGCIPQTLPVILYESSPTMVLDATSHITIPTKAQAQGGGEEGGKEQGCSHCRELPYLTAS